ncbi:helix-turn-helix domain-containing protein [Streptomyces sp. NPDC060194]|uniref:helix-turn-helix domain-containing protein n=1 Tax=Streptomyces sp. NPDC060194 TaxID=3347069 RepID=UPI00365317F4
MGANRYTNPVTDHDRDEIRRLHAEGHGRNEIARRLKRSPRTISEIAAAENPPLEFDRTATAVATAARVVDAKARRTAIMHRTYARVEKLLDRLEADEDAGYKFTATTVNGIETKNLDHVPGQEEKALAASISSYLTQATRLEALDGDPAVDNARSVLGTLAEGLARLAGQPGKDTTGEG